MLLQADFLDYLAKVQRVVSARDTFQSLGCPACQAIAGPAGAWLDAPARPDGEAEPGSDAKEFLQRNRNTLCQRCRLYLLLNAIQTILRAEDVPAWMEQPNLDLEGRTPLECVHQGRYAEVFEALWLLSEPGSCS